MSRSRNFLDNLQILRFKFNSRLKYFLKYKSYQDQELLLDNYKLVFEDNFENLDNWLISQAWGDFHPGDMKQYYGKTSDFVRIENNQLLLTSLFQPKKFYKKDLAGWQQPSNMPDEITINYGVGLVRTKQHFQYGYYEFEAQLPAGKNLWPAIWLTSVNAWPPEIDILEAYSDKGDLYKKYGLKDWQLQPNLHTGKDPDHGVFYAGNYPVRDCTKRFVKWGLQWEKDFIKIFYDGQLILHTTNKDILKWYNNEEGKMEIILNNGVIGKVESDDSVMKIKSVKVYQKP